MRLLSLLAVLAVMASADRILVLFDHMSTRDSHSIFFKQLTDRGHQLTYKSADDTSLALIKFGQLAYEHLIVFAPSVDEFGGSVSATEIGRFVDEGGNVLLAGSGKGIGAAFRDVVADNGFELAEQLIDHIHFHPVLDDGYHTTLVVDPKQLIGAKVIIGDAKINPIVYNGGALVSSKKNNLRLEVLKAGSNVYAHDPRKPITQYPNAVGKQSLLVSATQARNNARVVVAGSLDLFSNEYVNALVDGQRSGNLEFISALSKWTFKENGVLRVKDVKHHKVGEKDAPREYTIYEQVAYSIDIEELHEGKWRPFEGKDVQLEVVRIDPFVRTTLKNNKGRLSAQIKLPDVYGVFKFLVDYRRVGYTHLLDVQQVSIRPLEHTQYERFLRSAFPYYASSFSMMFSVVIFSFVFLYFKSNDQKKKTS